MFIETVLAFLMCCRVLCIGSLSVCVWCSQEALRRVADNGLKQYVRSRPAPSLDSVRRSKEMETPPVHPIFSELGVGERGEDRGWGREGRRIAGRE